MTDANPRPSCHGKEVSLSLRAFLGLLGVLVLPWVVIILLRLSPAGGWRACWTRDAEIREGPWGRLEIRDIAIAPLDILIPGQPGQSLPTIWICEGLDPAKLKDFILSLGLPESLRADLLATNAWAFADNNITLCPPDAAVLALDAASRIRLYDFLGATAANPDFFQPWSMKTLLFENRLVHSGLSEATRNLIHRLAYVRGARTFVSDIPVILNQLVDEDEKRRVMRFLSSASTYQVNLYVAADSDTDAITAYWGLRGRRKDIKPILESLAQLPRGGRLDIAHLLPAFARQRLYIYPSPLLVQDGIRRDCHWTSLNFSSLVADDRFGDPEKATHHILENYYHTGETPQYGDLALYMLPNGDCIHSAVYLAGNLVFTKNGDTLDQPWIIMDVDEIQELYSHYHHAPVGVQYWRLK